jgi:hypothetical protein
MYSRNQGIGVDRRLSPWLPAARPHCRPDAGGPIAIPEQMATTRLAGLSPEIGFSWPSRSLGTAASCHAERIRRSRQFSLVGSPLSNSRYASGIGRDDGSTKLKHQSAVEIESENLAVRFTPFWPKLRLSMSIGKTSKHSGISGLRTSGRLFA